MKTKEYKGVINKLFNIDSRNILSVLGDSVQIKSTISLINQ